MKLKSVFAIFVVAGLLTGCGEDSAIGSITRDNPVTTEEEAISIDSEVYESIYSENIQDVSTETYADVFDTSYNSYYDIKDGKAIPKIGETTTEASEESIEEIMDTTETASDANVEVVFKNEKSDTKSNSALQKQNYSAVSNITRTVTADAPLIDFENNAECEAQFILMDSGKVLYDSGVVKIGSKVSWNAYSDLSGGFHELEYQYIQMKDGEVVLTYAGVANITVEGGKND